MSLSCPLVVSITEFPRNRLRENLCNSWLWAMHNVLCSVYFPRNRTSSAYPKICVLVVAQLPSWYLSPSYVTPTPTLNTNINISNMIHKFWMRIFISKTHIGNDWRGSNENWFYTQTFPSNIYIHQKRASRKKVSRSPEITAMYFTNPNNRKA